MRNLPKILAVVVAIVVVYVGIKFVGASMDDHAFGESIANVIGPNQSDSVMRNSIVRSAQTMGIELKPENVTVKHQEPHQSTGPVASAVAPTLKVMHRTTVITVTYQRKIVPGWTRTVTLEKTRSYPVQTTAPSRKY